MAQINEGSSDSSSCIFPALKASTSFELFEANVDAVKATNKKWLALIPTKQAEFEAQQLILATNCHLPASAALLRVRRRWKANEFVNEQNQPDALKWVEASWAALKLVCEPMDRDARQAVREKIESLPSQAQQLFAGNIPELLNHFRVIRSDATKYNAGFTESALADVLIRASPPEYQALIRLKLEEQQEDPDKVSEVLERLARTTGAHLGLSHTGPAVKDEVFYVSSTDRPQTTGRVFPRGWGGRGGRAMGRGRARGFASAGVSTTAANYNASHAPSGGSAAGGGGRMCMRCGWNGFHAPGTTCPALHETCRGCGIRGHFERVCKQSAGQEAGRTSNQEPARPAAAVRFVDAYEGEADAGGAW
eukprot:GHVU01008365.1.p1 GENE.GHVU01008365.1~~GHVU01008365.1.p1  ORF type:complete len:364 (-),score=44.47 GHVU01008365.1:516-1607(-)